MGKKSEHSSEGENVKLVCKSESSHPPVTDWIWFKASDSGDQVRAVRDVRLRDDRDRGCGDHAGKAVADLDEPFFPS